MYDSICIVLNVWLKMSADERHMEKLTDQITHPNASEFMLYTFKVCSEVFING